MNYARPADAFTRRAPAVAPSLRQDHPTVARFLLDGPVLPLVTETVRVAEAFRAAAMSPFGTWCRAHSAEAGPFRRTDRPDPFSSRALSGRELNGVMRTDHAHYPPTAEGADQRRIAHRTIYAADGFGPGEIAAPTAVRALNLSVGASAWCHCAFN